MYFCLRSENCPWSGAILDKFQGVGDISYEASVQTQKERKSTIRKVHEDRDDSNNDL